MLAVLAVDHDADCDRAFGIGEFVVVEVVLDICVISVVGSVLFGLDDKIAR